MQWAVAVSGGQSENQPQRGVSRQPRRCSGLYCCAPSGLLLGLPGVLVATLVSFWSATLLSLPLLVSGRRGLADQIPFGPFLAQIRVRKFDLVLDLQRHLKSGLISWCSGARHRIGFNRADAKEMNWIFNNLHLERFGNQISKLDHYLKFAEYLGVPQQPVDWNFALSTAEQASVNRCLADVNEAFAVLFVGGWILQFVGHVYEGRRPALTDNLFQIFVAPIFLVAEAFFALGYKPRLREAVQRRAMEMRAGA